MIDIDLKKLRELAKAATQGEWVYDSDRHTSDSVIHLNAPPTPEYWNNSYTKQYYDCENGGIVGSSEWTWIQDRDGIYIAYANPENILKLLDYVKELETELEKCHAELYCTENTLDAASCDLPVEDFDQGFECMGDYTMAVWQGFKKENAALLAANRDCILNYESLKKDYDELKNKMVSSYGDHPTGMTMTGSLDHASKLADSLDEKSNELGGVHLSTTREVVRAGARMIRAFAQRDTVSYQCRQLFTDESVSFWSKWRNLEECDIEIWEGRIDRYPDMYQIRKLVLK